MKYSWGLYFFRLSGGIKKSALGGYKYKWALNGIFIVLDAIGASGNGCKLAL